MTENLINNPIYTMAYSFPILLTTTEYQS